MGTMLLQPNDHIVFYGDSITDAGRDRSAAPGDPKGWGFGYAHYIAAQLSSQLADYELVFSNKGISGNRIYDLEDRLENDVLSLSPDLVSILIGINDVWRRYDSGKVSPLDEFTASYRRVLERLTGAGPTVVILEPFLLPVPEDRRAWREDLNPKIEAIRDLAREFSLPLVPLDGLFAQASTKRQSAFWLPDGVHPSPAGHALIGSAWMDAVIG